MYLSLTRTIVEHLKIPVNANVLHVTNAPTTEAMNNPVTIKSCKASKLPIKGLMMMNKKPNAHYKLFKSRLFLEASSRNNAST